MSPRRSAATSLAVLSLVTVAACGGGGGSTAAVSSTPSSSTAAGAAPGVSGLVAGISGSTLQVQGNSTQTAVSYTSATAITATVPAKASDVAVGLCAVVGSASAQTTTAGGAAPTAFTATTVALTEPVNGSCAGGARGGGAPGGGQGFTPPTGAPSGMRPGFAGMGGGARGEITAVSGSTFTVASLGRPGAAAGSQATPSTTPVTVTTTSSTTYTKQQKATASALRTGTCVTARGAEDSSGAVQATSIVVRPSTDGTCSSRFGGPNG